MSVPTYHGLLVITGNKVTGLSQTDLIVGSEPRSLLF